MKRIAFRSVAVVLALFIAASAVLFGFAEENGWEEQITYTFNGVSYICTASAERNDQATEEEEYLLTFIFDSVEEPFQARLTEKCFSLDNSQLGMDHVYRQELWNVFAQYGLDLYRQVFGGDMVGRSTQGATRELHMHYWMFRLGNTLLQLVKPIELIAGKAPQVARLFKLLKTVYRRASVTELGPTDGSDLNGYVFEQANSDLQTMLLYGRDFLSVGFMEDVVNYTNGMQPDALARIDRLFFYPNELEKSAEILYVDMWIDHRISAC